MNTVVNQRLARVTSQRPSPDATPETAKSIRLSPIPLERFDEYAVVARLGHGGMAEVILGLAQGLQGFRKLVAIKRLHAHCEEDADLVHMFLQEASLAALLQHPNVVQTHKVGCANGRHFIAMEYLEGQPFQRVMQRLTAGRVGLDPVLAARVAADALDGLHHAHEACGYDGTPLGIVHRDVSPQNLFVTYDGQVKLLDFGIAKASSFSTQTRPGLIKGKLGYIAPEQARGEADRRADLWSVGVILWEGLTGRRLFRGDDEVAVLRAVLSGEVPRLADVYPNVPAQLADVVERALAHDRDERFGSAREMKDALDAWLVTQDQDNVRTVLACTLQSRFADSIRERREAVRECLGAVETEQRWQALAHGDSAIRSGVRTSMAPAVPPRSSRHGLKLGAAAGISLLLGSFLLLRDGALVDSRSHVESAPGAPTTLEKPSLAAAERPQAAAPNAGASAPLSQPRAVAAQTPTPLPMAALATTAQPPLSPRHHVRLSAKSSELAAPASPPDLPAEPVRDTVSDSSVASGRLRLEATPYAVVSLDGRRLGITPIDVELPATAHILTLRNPERGIETTYRVQVSAGESVFRRVELE